MSEKENILVNENTINIRTITENSGVLVEDALENVDVAAVVQESSDISEDEIVDIQIEEAFPYTADDDLFNHAILRNRDAANSHPIGAIEGLEKELRDIKTVKRIYSSENGLAEFIQWDDENPSWEDRSGYFVKLIYDTDTGVAHVGICTNKDDVYGVAVRNSGFVGNQINDQNGAGRSDDPAYAMVGIAGQLRVRTDGTAQIGDYIVPSAAGIATKSEYDCGYRVVSQGSYPSYEFVTIAVTPQNDKISKIYGMLMESGGSIGNILLRLDGLESDMVDAENKINVSIDNMDELKDLVNEHETEIDGFHQATNDLKASAQQAIENANQAIQEAHNARDDALAAAKAAQDVASDLSYVTDLAEEMEVIVDYNYTDDDGNVYSGAGGIIQSVRENKIAMGDIVTAVNAQGEDIASALLLADENGAAIQHLVSHIDKYSVGEKSLSYGLSKEDAMSILVNDYIYVPTSNHEEAMGEDIITFERGYAYMWNPASGEWIQGTEVSTATTYAEGENVGDLWYCWQDVEGPDGEYYIAETLYRWSGRKWIAVASIRDNYKTRMMSSIIQTADKIESKVVALDGSLSLVTQEVDKISSRVTDAEGNISTIDQEVGKINLTIGNINGTISSIDERVTDNTAQISMINYGTFHVTHQSFDSAPPDPIDGIRYSVPPLWNEEDEIFEFNDSVIAPDGAYYFHSEDKTKYVKVLDDGGYAVYTIGNKALSAIDSRISEAESVIATTNEFVTKNSEALALVTSKANANEASIGQLVEYNNSQDRTMAAIKQQADANGASISLVVKDGNVDGGVLVQAINNQTAAKINADSIVFSTGVTNEDGSFYMKLSEDSAVIRNGDFTVGNGKFRIILNPNDGIHVQKNINVDEDGNVVVVNPKWLSTFYTNSETGTTTIRGGCFRALGDDPENESDYTYSAVKQDGFYIYHESTMNEDTDPLDQIPKMKLSVNNEDGMSIRVEVGAGEGKTGTYADSGKLILSKTLEDGENIGKIYMGYNDGYYGFKLCKNTLELLPGTKFRGAIEWDSVNESDSGAYKTAQSASGTASSAWSDFQSLVAGNYTKSTGTFINGKNIFTARFYASEDASEGEFSTMNEDGFAIYRGAAQDMPKLELTVSKDTFDDTVSYGSQIRVALGAGAEGSASGGWADNGRLILEKYLVTNNQIADENKKHENVAEIYYKYRTDKIGFCFGYDDNDRYPSTSMYAGEPRYNTISLLKEGTKFDFNKGIASCVGGTGDFTNATVYFTNATVDFANATVTGLTTVAVFG